MSKQFATWDEVAIELVGVGGWQHGWKPGGPAAAAHDKAAALHTAAAGKAKDPAVKAQHQRRARVHAQVARKLRSLTPPPPITPAAVGLAWDWDDLGTLIEMAVVPGETGTIGAQTPATAGTARGHGRPDESRTTWPIVATRRIPTMPTSITGSRNSEAHHRTTLASTAAGRQLTGRPSTAGTGPVRTTSSPSASRATTSTTDPAPATPANSTADPNSPTSRYLTSGAVRLKVRQLSLGSSVSPRSASTRSSRAATGPGSLELSATTRPIMTSGANATPAPGSAANRYWPSTLGGMRVRQPSDGSSAYPRGLSGGSSTGAPGLTSLELSAKTAQLEATPAPRGKPGGPGLYHQKGNAHSPYLEQIVKALIEKRGMPPGKAYAIAWGAMRKWAAGGGKVHPEVRAAAAGGLGLEKAAAARAHAHAVTWDDHAAVLEMAITRVAAGQAGGGQFGSGGGAPVAGPNPAQKAAAKAALLATAKNDRAQAAQLGKQRSVLRKALASAGGAVSKGQSGAKSVKQAGAKTAAKTTPAAAAAKAKATTAAKAKVKAAAVKAPGSAARAAKIVQIKGQIAGLNTQINGLLAAANAATAQAAKL